MYIQFQDWLRLERRERIKRMDIVKNDDNGEDRLLWGFETSVKVE